MNSAQLLPAIREFYSGRPEYFHHETLAERYRDQPKGAANNA
jgi:hypothetical protein